MIITYIMLSCVFCLEVALIIHLVVMACEDDK